MPLAIFSVSRSACISDPSPNIKRFPGSRNEKWMLLAYLLIVVLLYFQIRRIRRDVVNGA